jgi:alanyl-tRNA synthetase
MHLRRLAITMLVCTAPLTVGVRAAHRLSRAAILGPVATGGVASAPAPRTAFAQMCASSAESWTAERTRRKFLDFFSSKHNHSFVTSSPVVPHDDPTLLFTNAGMNQFKPIFVGQVASTSPLASLERAANSQKCIRAGGKHNDLDDVGFDTYHHTFFEMLGSWSFGDYFKEEAIAMAFELLTKEYGLDPSRLYATYFEGDEAMGLEPDLEARGLWKHYLPEDHILPGDSKDNFWEMGETGPCGPCSELHYDRIGGRNAASLVNQDDPDVLEIWNLVFMQFNREDAKTLRPLPAKHVDTGMGFERLVSVLQDKPSNYDTDLFLPIFAEIQKLTGAPAYQGRLGEEDPELIDTAYRVVADHIRTLTVAIADGATPNNEGRGYVLRRILRRGLRYGRQKLGAPPGLFAALVPAVVESLAGTFPEIRAKQEAVAAVLAEEEESFSAMLARGIKELNERAAALKAKGGTMIDGDAAFFLYDSMGFPLDLTTLMAAEMELTVDEEGFKVALAAQRTRSAAAGKAARGGADTLSLSTEASKALLDSGVADTDDSDKYEWAAPARHSSLAAILTADGFSEAVDADADAQLGLVLDRTAFYAEAGGQAADCGRLLSDDGETVFKVTHVQAYGGYVLHTGKLLKGSLAKGKPLTCEVSYATRRKTAPNHTLTHLLNAALVNVLGDGVFQKGSLVDEAKLRFDFSHAKALSADELQQVENHVQTAVADALPVHSAVVPLERARAIDGLRAVFGEANPDPVRVVSVGATVEALLGEEASQAAAAASIELCGGTHIANTAEAQAFALVEETAVAKGIRWLTGVTGELATAASSLAETLESAFGTLGLGSDKSEMGAFKSELDGATISAHRKEALRARFAALEKEHAAEAKRRSNELTQRATAAALEAADAAAAAGRRFAVVRLYDGFNPKSAQALLKQFGKQQPRLALLAFAANVDDEKVACFAAVPANLQQQLAANGWVGAALAPCNGRGGGKAASAQGSGSGVAQLPAAIEAAQAFASEALE